MDLGRYAESSRVPPLSMAANAAVVRLAGQHCKLSDHFILLNSMSSVLNNG